MKSWKVEVVFKCDVDVIYEVRRDHSRYRAVNIFQTRLDQILNKKISVVKMPFSLHLIAVCKVQEQKLQKYEENIAKKKIAPHLSVY